MGEEFGGFAAVAYESPSEDEDSEPTSETRPKGDESIDCEVLIFTEFTNAIAIRERERDVGFFEIENLLSL